MNMMMNNDGTVDFHATLFALVRTSLNVKRPDGKHSLIVMYMSKKQEMAKEGTRGDTIMNFFIFRTDLIKNLIAQYQEILWYEQTAMLHFKLLLCETSVLERILFYCQYV